MVYEVVVVVEIGRYGCVDVENGSGQDGDGRGVIACCDACLCAYKNALRKERK